MTPERQKRLPKNGKKRFASTVGELNNHIAMIDENGDEISGIGGWTCRPRCNAGDVIYV